ncbi:MAG: Rne/Rng family ribonuclease [Deltaproteobacteria bacterium]|nr:Rne/Rng family ribonuclease [Deltaproteobacteria bacterium]
MTKKMLINAMESEEHRIAFIDDGMLDGFHIDTASSEQKEGNIVERVESRLQACFVNYGGDRNGFLPADAIHPEYFHDAPDVSKDQAVPPIGKVIKKGQELLVEVVKDMPGHKGAHLTTYVSLAGRYAVLTPGRTINGISRKIEDEEERQRLKSIMGKIKTSEDVGYIVRTVAVGKNKRELSRDLNRLLRLWKSIRKNVAKAPPLSLIHKEQDLSLRTLRDYFTSDVTEVIVDDTETYKKINEYMKIISPRDQKKVKLYKEKRPIFDHFDIEKQIERIYLNRVPLKSGGSIVFDTTEALIAIDVNSGRGKTGKDVESMVFRTNMEAAPEIARQLRLRDLGGLVVIDFIDMRGRNHIREVEKALREELKKDRAKTDTSSISKFGIMELSRQRLRPSIESKSYQTCDYCQGRGVVISVGAAAVSFMRRISMGVSKGDIVQVNGTLPTEVADYIQNRKRNDLASIENRFGVSISIVSDHTLPPGEGKLDFVKEGKATS